jgi:hypothetical protein
VDIGVLEVDYFSESAFPAYPIPKKNRIIKVVIDFRKLSLLMKLTMSPFSYSKYWYHDPFNGRYYLLPQN